jgi:hypothetical protein
MCQDGSRHSGFGPIADVTVPPDHEPGSRRACRNVQRRSFFVFDYFDKNQNGPLALLAIQRRWWRFSWQAESDEPIGRLVPLKEETFVHGTAAQLTKPLWGCEVFCSNHKEEMR